MRFMKMKIQFQKGLTLVELLIASFLGIFLTGVIGAMYITSSQGFRSTNELSRIQENTRFALHFLQQSIREAGFSTCGEETRDYSFLVDPFNSTVGGGLVGYEFAGTAAGETFDLTYTDLDSEDTNAAVAAARTNNAGAVTDWASMPGAPALDEMVNNFFPIEGSDIIAVTTEQSEPDMQVTGSNTNRLNVTLLNEADALPQGAIVKVGNCFERNIFVKGTAGNNINSNNGAANVNNLAVASRPPATTNNPFSQPWPAGTTVFSDTTRVFYVGTGTSGIPSLFVYESLCGFLTAADGCLEAAVPNELVEGVESMQVMYGVDGNDDGVAEQYVPADEIATVTGATDFSDVVNVRISLLMRSNELSEVLDAGATFALSDVINITPIDKGVLRYVSNATVELRSRGE